MSLKIAYLNKISIIQHFPNNIEQLHKQIQKIAPNSPSEFLIHYLDEENDEIQIIENEDLQALSQYLKNKGLKIIKLYVKHPKKKSRCIDRSSNLIMNELAEKTYQDSLKNQLQNSEDIQNIYYNHPYDHIDSSIDHKDFQKNLDYQQKKQSNHSVENLSDSNNSLQEKNSDMLTQKQILVSSFFQDQANDAEKCKMYIQLFEKDEEQEYQSKKIFNHQVEEEEKKREELKSLKEKNMIHKNVICDICKACPIIGIRYKCSVCYDFDVCEKCELKEDHIHPFLKIKTPDQFNMVNRILFWPQFDQIQSLKLNIRNKLSLWSQKVKELIDQRKNNPINKKQSQNKSPEIPQNVHDEELSISKIQQIYEVLGGNLDEIIAQVQKFDEGTSVEEIIDNILEEQQY